MLECSSHGVHCPVVALVGDGEESGCQRVVLRGENGGGQEGANAAVDAQTRFVEPVQRQEDRVSREVG